MAPKNQSPTVQVKESWWKILRREVFSALIIAGLLGACTTLYQIQLNMTKLVVDVNYLVKKVDSVENVNNVQSECLLDHEKRLIHLETLRGVSRGKHGK